MPNDYSALASIDRMYFDSVCANSTCASDSPDFAYISAKDNGIIDETLTKKEVARAFRILLKNTNGIPTCKSWKLSGTDGVRSCRPEVHTKDEALRIHRKQTAGLGGRLWSHGNAGHGELGQYADTVKNVSDAIQDALQTIYKLVARIDKAIERLFPKEHEKIVADGTEYMKS